MISLDCVINFDNNTDIKQELHAGIDSFNQSVTKEKVSNFTISIHDNDLVVGGAIVYKHKDALYVDVFWVHESYRKQGLGTKILQAVEDEARQQAIGKVFVDTYSFQAQGFYEKLGYKVISIVPKYLLGHDRIFLQKILS